MKKKKFITLLLSLSFICAMIFPPVATKAQNGGEQNVDDMVIDKTATDNGDGTYTITLEAYATGSSTITPIVEDVPMDVVLVLDQSGSMSERIGTPYFEAYSQRTNSQYYSLRHNGGTANLWHQLGVESYVPVYVDRQETIGGAQQLNVNFTNSNYYYYRDALYEKVGEEYKKVNLSRRQYYNYYTYSYYYVYTYEFYDGTRIYSYYNSGYPNLGTRAPLYTATAVYDYTYTYIDNGGITQIIGTSNGANTLFNTTLYERKIDPTTGVTRLEALKNAVTTFVNSVATKAAGADGLLGTEDDVKHRIAVVGFASGSYYYYNNTELLSISGTNSGNMGIKYDEINNQNLLDVIHYMNTVAGQDMIANAIDALSANGATQVDLGMDMAYRILNANPDPDGKDRNRYVVVFTDGAPTTYRGFNKTVANNAITTANNIRGLKSTIYTVGVFSGADPSSPGVEPAGDLDQGSSSIPAASNWFMQNLSCNKGMPQVPSFYLAASDAESLNNVFQQIIEQIELGGCTVTLDENTVIRDVIAPSFSLPENATSDDITLETYACIGMEGGEYTWSKNPDAMGATVALSSTNNVYEDQLNVTGFNFSDNYVGTVTQNGNVTYRGHKLVIKFTVVPRPGFLGGNAVETNTTAAIYENPYTDYPIMVFPQPKVDVSIPTIEITVPSGSKDIYLLQGIPLEDISEGVAVKIGTVNFNLDPNAVNWGLEAWQNEYIDVVVTYKDANGNPIPAEGLQKISSDTSYSVSVSVEPKYTGTVSGAGGTQTGGVTINVFKPELTFKDGSVYYGATAPTDADYASNLTSTIWKHNGVEANEIEMGVAPTLTLTYTPESSKIVDGKIATKKDIKVNTIVKIGEVDITDKTVFLHTPCNPPCGWNENILDGSPAFLLHVKTCALTVVKTGGVENESYVFEVKKDGVKYTELTIWGNGSKTLVELPVGNYTIEENTGWSWRYNADNGGTVILSAANPEGSITCTNSSNGKDNWLNGFSEIVQNIYNAIQ